MPAAERSGGRRRDAARPAGLYMLGIGLVAECSQSVGRLAAGSRATGVAGMVEMHCMAAADSEYDYVEVEVEHNRKTVRVATRRAAGRVPGVAQVLGSLEVVGSV